MGLEVGQGEEDEVNLLQHGGNNIEAVFHQVWSVVEENCSMATISREPSQPSKKSQSFLDRAEHSMASTCATLPLSPVPSSPSELEIWYRITRPEEYVKVVVLRGRIIGALLIGETDLEEVFENLILNSLDVSKFGVELLNPDRDIEDYFD